MELLDYNSLLKFVKGIEKTPLRTKAQKKEFIVEISKDGLIYTPSSTGKPRLHSKKFVERFIDEFNKTKSLQPGHYHHISANASYLLVIIEDMLNKEEIEISQPLKEPKKESNLKLSCPTWLQALIYQVKTLKSDHEHQERAHESLVENFFELLGYQKFDEIKHRQGRIDISLKLNDQIYLLTEVKRNWNLSKDLSSALHQAYRYATEFGVRFVLVTNGDYYSVYDRLKGISYDSNFIGEFTITDLSDKDLKLIEFFKKDKFLKIIELSKLGAEIHLPKID